MATLAQKWTGTLTDFTREVEQYTSDRCTEMVSRCRDGRLSAPPLAFPASNENNHRRVDPPRRTIDGLSWRSTAQQAWRALAALI